MDPLAMLDRKPLVSVETRKEKCIHMRKEIILFISSITSKQVRCLHCSGAIRISYTVVKKKSNGPMCHRHHWIKNSIIFSKVCWLIFLWVFGFHLDTFFHHLLSLNYVSWRCSHIEIQKKIHFLIEYNMNAYCVCVFFNVAARFMDRVYVCPAKKPSIV